MVHILIAILFAALGAITAAQKNDLMLCIMSAVTAVIGMVVISLIVPAIVGLFTGPTFFAILVGFYLGYFVKSILK